MPTPPVTITVPDVVLVEVTFANNLKLPALSKRILAGTPVADEDDFVALADLVQNESDLTADTE
jgi:hypothetical protein